jgi:hypothetical protein
MDNKKSITDVKMSQTREDFNKDFSKKNKISMEKASTYKVSNRKGKIIFLSASFFVIFVIVFSSFFLHSASIKIKSKKESIFFLNDVYTAKFSEGGSKIIDDVVERSVGKIKILNKTKSTQILREETRFQIGDGEEKVVYKIKKRVAIKPNGEVVAEAYSDGFGQKYNRKKDAGQKLQIPGFKEAKKEAEYKYIFGYIEQDFVFSKSGSGKGEIKGELKTLGFTNYEKLIITSKTEQSVKSIGVEEISKKSEGKIKIINKTSENQKLRKETRFKNGDLVFKTYKSVTVPANSSVIVNSFSDNAGEQYNLKKDTVFNIPGFKEAKMTEEYEKITAVSYSDFVGGMVGKVNIPNKKDLDNAKENLLKKSLVEMEGKKQKHEKNDEYIFLSSFSDTENTFSVRSVGEENVVTIISIQKNIIIKKSDFIEMILKSDNKEELKDIEISDFSKLSFEVVDNQNFDVDSQKNLLFSVNGDAEVS